MRVAITGGIAEGKSTVMRYLRELGEKTASADEIAREVFQEAGVQQALSVLLGSTLPVEASHVREAIAGRSDLRRAVNRLMHPQIARRIEDSPAHWFEVPLLLETCWQASFDSVWVVTCGREEQLARLSERLGDQAEAKRLISTQLSSAVKCIFADEVIRTNLSEGSVKTDVKLAVERENAK